jgi:hypothetical protein
MIPHIGVVARSAEDAVEIATKYDNRYFKNGMVMAKWRVLEVDLFDEEAIKFYWETHI